MHGVGGKIDFGIYERHVKAANDIGISVFVQHGTSTIKDREDFRKLPLGGVGEAHLATEYQKIHLGVIASIMPDLAEEMARFMEGLMDKNPDTYGKKFRDKWNAAFNSKSQESKTRHQIIVEILSDNLPDTPSELLGGKSLRGSLKDLAKEVSGPFKDKIWNLPDDAKQAVNNALHKEFSEVMEMLGLSNTKNMVEAVIPTKDLPEIYGSRPAALEAALKTLDDKLRDVNPVNEADKGV
jgi:hypothetical protein